MTADPIRHHPEVTPEEGACITAGALAHFVAERALRGFCDYTRATDPVCAALTDTDILRAIGKSHEILAPFCPEPIPVDHVSHETYAATWDGPPGQPCPCPNLAGDCDGSHGAAEHADADHEALRVLHGRLLKLAGQWETEADVVAANLPQIKDSALPRTLAALNRRVDDLRSCAAELRELAGG